MGRFVCVVVLSLLAANVANAAAAEQDDWGFSVESSSGSSNGLGTFQTFGGQIVTGPAYGNFSRPAVPYRSFAPQPNFGQPVFGAQPYNGYRPYAPAPRAFRTTPVYQAPQPFFF